MVMQMHIPDIGTAYILRADWHFRLYNESRNYGLIAAVAGIDQKKINRWTKEGQEALAAIKWRNDPSKTTGYNYGSGKKAEGMEFLDVTMPEGTVLSISRLYIRNGAQSSYNSVTFRTGKKGGKKEYCSKRFWVSLADANTIVCDLIGI